jgi:hypothetical protein
VVDFVEAQEVVVIVDGVERVNKLVDVSIVEVELEGRKDVEVGPSVKIKANFKLFFVDDALFVKKVKQSVEYFQFLQFETEVIADHCPLPDAFVAALDLSEVLPEWGAIYLTILEDMRYDFLFLRFTKL